MRRLTIDIFEVDRTALPKQMKIRLIVADSLGNFIRGLSPPDLSEAQAKKIFMEIIEKGEDGKSNYMTDFKVSEINEKIAEPYDIALCLDYSGSMSGYISDLEKAINKVVNTKDDRDFMSIVRFNHDLFTDTRLKKNNEELTKQWVERKKIALGGTALYAGADEALASFDSISGNQKVLFLLTDGQENSSLVHLASGRACSVQKLAQKARKLGVKIFPIGLGGGVNEKLLIDLVWLTDGKAIFRYESKDIEAMYKELSQNTKNYYEITYKTNHVEEGKQDVLLKYNNNRQVTTASTQYYIGDKFRLFEEQGFISPENKNIPKQAIVPKQAVALFDSNNAILNNNFTANIDAVVLLMKQNPQASVDILGHTNLTGTDEKNTELSKNRAESVATYLINKGIDKTRINLKAMSSKNPIWKKEREEWQAKENRRVEVLVWE